MQGPQEAIGVFLDNTAVPATSKHSFQAAQTVWFQQTTTTPTQNLASEFDQLHSAEVKLLGLLKCLA